MGDVSLESERTIKPGHEFLSHLERRLGNGTTLTAYDMDVGRVRGEVIARDTVVDVGVAHEAQLLERLERAIDGRERHGGFSRLGDKVDDLLGRRVTEALDRVEHLLALRREPPSGGSQTRAEITHPTNVCRSVNRAERRT